MSHAPKRQSKMRREQAPDARDLPDRGSSVRAILQQSAGRLWLRGGSNLPHHRLVQTHSTFHYEFTRVLAAAAGFQVDDAETIAVANEATDTGGFTGYAINSGAKSAAFTNTQRLGGDSATLWYHMARRSQDYPVVTQPDGTAYPGALQNTCGYFTQPSDKPVLAPCADTRNGELDQLRNW